MDSCDQRVGWKFVIAARTWRFALDRHELMISHIEIKGEWIHGTQTTTKAGTRIVWLFVQKTRQTITKQVQSFKLSIAEDGDNAIRIPLIILST